MFDRHGQRKYLSRSEIKSFLKEAAKCDAATHTFCWVLAATGCRISEALALCPDRFDFEMQHVVIESLKKRRRRVFRAIPLSSSLLSHLGRWLDDGYRDGERVWTWSRMTGYRRVSAVMAAAGIFGTAATPRGLRHGFAVSAVQSGVPLNLVQRWLGHADIRMTAIYTAVSGPEERDIASRMWRDNPADQASRMDPMPRYDLLPQRRIARR